MQKVILWILAFFLTVGLAIYQRETGPTYPVTGSEKLGNHVVSYEFETSHGGAGDQEVAVNVPGDHLAGAILRYRRFRSGDSWTEISMLHQGDNYTAFLPHQPPAGKLEYQVVLKDGDRVLSLPEKPVVTRFKGAVPLGILLPHVLFMFTALLLTVRIGLGLTVHEDRRKLVGIAVLFLGIGGLILGPLVQKFAFGQLWTGVPFGWDLTDNKTLIAFLCWLPALYLTRKNLKWQRRATAFAVLVMFLVYLVPHSVWGSEFNYKEGKVTTGIQKVQVKDE
ncbi:MAG: hypothetical protein GXO69_07560 [Acidobacteria bacterium]|nr:hypothetical protein [Acidobacteriota bacterium]